MELVLSLLLHSVHADNQVLPVAGVASFAAHDAIVKHYVSWYVRLCYLVDSETNS